MEDFCVIGGGIVGLATALKLLEAHPGASLRLLEQEPGLAHHQTGHNSGVIHSGIYYQPGSEKSRLCRAGAEATKAFCRANAIPFESCGKLLVATTPAELRRMDDLAARATQNAIAIERLTAPQLVAREPNIAGLGALFIPSTGIVDYRRICTALAANIRTRGGEITTGSRVIHIAEHPDYIALQTTTGAVQSRHLIACAGLQADRIAALAGLAPNFQIIPFRGEYYRLPAHRAGLINALIYPIPDPALPFLGIHLTRTMDGGITVGPNAILSLARQTYAKFAVNPTDTLQMLRFPGLWRLLAANLRPGLTELRGTFSKRAYLAAARTYCPSLTLDDLQPEPAGIRAQAVLPDGTLVHDFLFHRTARSLHVCNAPSPAATSALPIGAHIAGEITRQRAALTA